METLEINAVEGPNDRGWFNVELSDGRTATTKDKKLAELAFKSRGVAVQVDVTEKVNGKFTNVYLNKLEVAGGDSPLDTPAETNAVVAPKEPVAIPKSTEQERQERIARQWAYGRAVELLIGTEATGLLPLNSANKKALEGTAEWLLSQTK